jgi:molecular chaperone GrpE (heat shock protein)
MANLTEFTFGLLLWLGTCFFIFMTISNSSRKNSSAKMPLLPIKKNISSNPYSDINNQNNQNNQDNQDNQDNIVSENKSVSIEIETKIKELEQKLQEKIEELNLAEEKINALQEELELTSNELEFAQNKASSFQHKLEQENRDLQGKIKSWQNKYSILNQKFEQQAQQLMLDWQQETFDQLQSLLANYPTARMMVKLKPKLPAQNLMILLKPLEDLWRNWDVEQIGKPWQKIPFNPQIHEPDRDDIIEGESVYIRFVGYRQGDRILLPAKVSRNLPKGG